MDNGVQEFSVISHPPQDCLSSRRDNNDIIITSCGDLKILFHFRLCARFPSIFSSEWIFAHREVIMVDYTSKSLSAISKRSEGELCALLSALVTKVSLWFTFLGSPLALQKKKKLALMSVAMVVAVLKRCYLILETLFLLLKFLTVTCRRAYKPTKLPPQKWTKIRPNVVEHFAEQIKLLRSTFTLLWF